MDLGHAFRNQAVIAPATPDGFVVLAVTGDVADHKVTSDGKYG